MYQVNLGINILLLEPRPSSYDTKQYQTIPLKDGRARWEDDFEQELWAYDDVIYVYRSEQEDAEKQHDKCFLGQIFGFLRSKYLGERQPLASIAETESTWKI